jgi:PAS domain S-box-containing protein
MFGYTAAQIVGNDIEMLLTERMRDARLGEIQAYLQGGEPQLVGKGHAVLPAVRKDGSIIHLEAIVNALPTTEGQLFVAVMRDVTERRKAEAELFADKERLRVTLESIGDGVITTDTHGCVTYLNPVAERMTGWNNEDAIGHPLPTVLVLTEEGSPDPPPNPVELVLRDGVVAGLTERLDPGAPRRWSIRHRGQRRADQECPR